MDSLTGTKVSAWLQAEFNKPATTYLPRLITEAAALPADEDLESRRITDLFLDAAIAGDDQLRQRMMFALSEIIVVSNIGQLDNFPLTMAHYMDILSTHAFGNYRELLEEVTYTPAMGVYLTYLANEKGDSDTGRVPDENYARELMQLFTIGLVELNLDGTPKLDGQGQTIETYDNSDITGLAKVFTGISLENSEFFRLFRDKTDFYKPMIVFDDYHSDLEKTFLTVTIPANTPGVQSIDMALDEIFNHPNMAPFLSRQLIQRFVTSHPKPAYVGRVAAAFESGTYILPDGISVGTGQRGDLKATIAAVLLDDNAVRSPAAAPNDFGKVREPILRFAQWARAFNETTPDVNNEIWLYGEIAEQLLGQHPFRAKHVFNFFRPGYVAPGTATGDAGLTAPEFEIINESTSISVINFMNGFIYSFSPTEDDDEDAGVNADYTAELAIADDAQALVDRLDLLLTGNSLRQDTKDRIVQLLGEIPVRAGTETEDKISRVTVATSMVMTAPGYLVQR